MNKVKNKKAVSGLAFHELKSSRLMNFVIMVSIVLTCVMFTALATIGGSTMNGFQRQTMRQVGGDRMAGLKHVRQRDYEKVLADPKTKDVVYRRLVGTVKNESLRNINIEVNFPGDENSAKAVFSLPTTGRLPREMDEIATSDLALAELGIPCELGAIVPLTISIDGEVIEQEFKLSGFWEGDPISMAQMLFVSEAFADKYAPTPDEDFYSRGATQYAGYWQVDFNFSNSFNIEGKTIKLVERLYQKDSYAVQYGVNWAYSMSSMDFDTVWMMLLFAMMIFVAGYLIIYNIFQINISANVRKYGLLKTIGMTRRQIRRLVQIQTRVYCLIGIPVGILIGLFFGKILFGSFINVLTLDASVEYHLNAFWVVVVSVFAAAFTYLTVMISCRKPASMAGNASPMEALRYNETEIKTKKDHKKTGKVHPITMALSNLLRSKKKTVIVILSLSLSLILLNTMVTFFKGVDMDKYVQRLMIGDLQVTNASSVSGYVSRIKPEEIKAMKNADSIRECDAFYRMPASVRLTGKAMEKAEKLYEKHANAEKWEEKLEEFERTGDYVTSREFDTFLTLRNLAKGAEYSEKGVVTADVYGIEPSALDLISVDHGTLDAEKFATGKYVLVNTAYTQLESAYRGEDQFYEVGDMLTMETKDGITKEYEVMAIADVPYPLSTKIFYSVYAHLILPITEYETLGSNQNALSAVIFAEEGREKEAEEFVRSITDQPGTSLILSNKETVMAEFEDMVSAFRIMGGSLAGILALIGALNYINAMVTSMLARRKEFAMMSAVGMTGKQLEGMLIWEGIAYAIGTLAASAVLGSFISAVLMRGFERITFFYTYHFTLLPILLGIPFLLSLAVVIPIIAYHHVSKESVVQRLRENE
ncbi:MAG: FtsX-like permease family protein [Lachnospiraceae bacterium]|nr:FtsX-like permease family protein [Lachnospiraceae bacterium]